MSPFQNICLLEPRLTIGVLGSLRREDISEARPRNLETSGEGSLGSLASGATKLGGDNWIDPHEQIGSYDAFQWTGGLLNWVASGNPDGILQASSKASLGDPSKRK